MAETLPTGTNGVVLVMESEGAARHFMVDRVFRRSGLVREHFAIHIGMEGLAVLLASRPDITVVVPMGAAMLLALLGEPDLMRWRGRVVRHTNLQRWCLPTLHPSELLARPAPKGPGRKKKPLQNPPRFTRVLIEDLHHAVQVAREGYDAAPARDYTYDPSPEVLEQWIDGYEAALAADPSTYLSWDIETPYKQKNADEGEWDESEFDQTILRVSFSYKPHHGMTTVWDAAHLAGIKRLLGSRGPKVVWNGTTFDVPVVQSVGVEVRGEVFDFMDGWKVLHSDLPKGLEFVTSMYTQLLPWKHLSGSDPQLYSCIDSDAALQNAIGIERDLKARGMWKTFLRHAVYLMPILAEAGQRGNLVDEPARQALEAELVAEYSTLLQEIQTVVPDVLRPTKRYKKRPEGLTFVHTTLSVVEVDGQPVRRFQPVVVEAKVKACSVCGEKGITKSLHFKGKGNPCKALEGKVVVVDDYVTQWDELLDFNPNSSDQLITYMKHFNHPVGQIFDDPDGESADSKHLRKLANRYPKHPVYTLTLKAHKLNKAIGTYVRGLAPDANGLVHTTYVNSPSTWRLGSRDVNMQNQGKRAGNLYAKRSRRVLIARPGNVFVQADSSSIEAVFVGKLMGDDAYIDLAKQSIHAWLCCQVLGWAFTPENVGKIKHDHKALYDQMKVTNHMTNYGGTPPVLVEQFPDVFPTLASAKKAQSYIFALLPQLEQWQNDMRVRAQKETFLETPWKHRHEFYDVFTLSEGKVKLGKDAKRAIAFAPQNAAGSFMRDNLLIMGTSLADMEGRDPEAFPWVPEEDRAYLYSGKWRQYMGANVSVHDGYTLDVPEALQQEAQEYLIRLLTRPIAEMGGLRVGCEVEVGKNWLDMTSVAVVKA